MTRKFLAYSSALLFAISALAQTQNPPAPGITSASGTDVQAFQTIEDKWDEAVNNRDQYALELVLSPLYVGISANGDINSRNQELVAVIVGQDKTLHLDQHIITVRLLGDTAVTNGTYTLHHRAASGQMDEKGVFTHVFEKQRNGWVCVNSQRTVLREEGPPGKGRKNKQSGSAELPFHIPLFSKDDKAKQ